MLRAIIDAPHKEKSLRKRANSWEEGISVDPTKETGELAVEKLSKLFLKCLEEGKI